MSPPTRLLAGRYALLDHLASGGMGAVYLGAMRGQAGFVRAVAIKQMRPGLLAQPQLVRMFIDEARMLSRIRHPSVIAPIDFFEHDAAFYLVMELVIGESVGRLLRELGRSGQRVPTGIAARIAHDALLGLSAAHLATDDRGAPLDLVHRDVSPQNLLVGVDGLTRVLDFGIAKATQRLHKTVGGFVMGKLGYLAPEQLTGDAIDARVDVYTLGIVLWEMLAGRRLFEGSDPSGLVLGGVVPRLSEEVGHVSASLDALLARALSVDRQARFASAGVMADALARTVHLASATDVSEWLLATAAGSVATLRERVQTAEQQGWEALTVPAVSAPAIAIAAAGQKVPTSAALGASTTTSTTAPAAPPAPFGFVALTVVDAAHAAPPDTATVAAALVSDPRARPGWLGLALLLYGGLWAVTAAAFTTTLALDVFFPPYGEWKIPLAGSVVSLAMAAIHLGAGVRERRRGLSAMPLVAISLLALGCIPALGMLSLAMPPLFAPALLAVVLCVGAGLAAARRSSP